MATPYPTETKWITIGNALWECLPDGRVMVYKTKRDVAGGWYWALAYERTHIEGRSSCAKIIYGKGLTELPKAAHFRQARFLAKQKEDS